MEMRLNGFECQGCHFLTTLSDRQAIVNVDEDKRDKRIRKKLDACAHVGDVCRVTSRDSQGFKTMERTAKQDASRSADLKPNK